MRVGVLGPLEVSVDGRRSAPPGRKARVVLCALVMQNGLVVGVDRLIEILWGPTPPETAGNTLQTYVSQVRGALEPGRAARQPSRYLATTPGGYRLTLPAGAVDADRFERLAGAGRDAASEEAARQLRAALELWRGEPYPDLAFEPFAQAEIARLVELRLAATDDLTDVDLRLGRHQNLCAQLPRLVAEHPLRERRWAQLMLALYRCGRQAEALQAFADLRATLVEQLGIEPSQQLARLQEAILRQEPNLDLPPASAPAGTEPARAVEEAPDLAAARSSLGRLEWERAYGQFAALDRATALSAADLDGLAEAALWSARPKESLAARERAHEAFVDEGNLAGAVATALFLSAHHAVRLHPAVAGGWFQRAARLLEQEPRRVEHGYLAWTAAVVSIETGDPDTALEHARAALQVGEEFGVRDLQALALCAEGYVRVRQGELGAGLGLLDTAMTWAVEGVLRPFSTAYILCRTVRTCYDLRDYRRAAEWLTAMAGCTARTGMGELPGDCDSHRVGVLAARGSWTEGELLARKACARQEPFDLTHVALTLHEMGEIRLRLGDLDAAGEAFERALSLGRSPQPGAALLLSARGEAALALRSISGALAEEWDLLARSRLLPVQVEVALALHDLEVAEDGCAELERIAGTYPGPGLTAAATTARGRQQLASGRPEAAESLRRAVRLWHGASEPYEVARTREQLAEALRAERRWRAADAELQAALDAYLALGARRDLDRGRAVVDRAVVDRVRAVPSLARDLKSASREPPVPRPE